MRDEADPWITAITPERIERALAGFPLQLTDGWDFTRLTEAIQNIANLGRDIVQLGPTRQSDREAKLELEELARSAEYVLDRLEAPGNTAFHAVIARAAFESDARTGHFGYDSDAYRRDFLVPLRLISNMLELAAADVGKRPPQKPGWTKKEARAMRVRFALMLAEIFEDAFGQKPHSWPDFYQRIHADLFGQMRGLNLQRVLQAVARIRAGKGKVEDIGTYSFLIPPRVGS